MLKRLCIRNFAIIESVDLELSKGFIAITGETGAGKSILFDALGLILGGRATVEMVRYGSEQAEVEGVFELSPSQAEMINPILAENGCPEDDDLYIKRIVTSAGRNRVFINGSRSTLALLQHVTAGLVDVIGQHASHHLLEPTAHLPVVDTFAQTQAEAAVVASKVAQWRRLNKEVAALRAEESNRKQRIALLQNQLDEIQLAEVKEGEDERIEAELERLLCAEDIRERTQIAVQMMRDQEGSVLDLLSAISDSIRRVSHAAPELDALLDPLAEVSVQLREMCHDLRPFSETGDVSPEDIEILQERLEHIRRLKIRHGGTIQGILLSAESIALELEQLQGANKRITVAEKEAQKLENVLMTLSCELSLRRQASAQALAKIVELELRELSMPHCRFRVVFRFKDGNGTFVDGVEQAHASTLSSAGLDDVEFEISPNPGEGFKSMAKVASGGELSRILLALKGAMIQTDPVSSYVFDEVDTGIGGGVAETVGRKLQRVGDARQAICITHLPQVACCAHQHIFIQKEVSNNRTHSTLRYLNFEERVVEIGRMLGGAELTDMTKAHAQELLLNNQPQSTHGLRLVN